MLFTMVISGRQLEVVLAKTASISFTVYTSLELECLATVRERALFMAASLRITISAEVILLFAIDLTATPEAFVVSNFSTLTPRATSSPLEAQIILVIARAHIFRLHRVAQFKELLLL